MPRLFLIIAAIVLGVSASARADAPKLTKAPALLKFVPAPYPPSEKASGHTASVVLRLTISETGTVTTVEITTSGGPAFDEAARAAAIQLRFSPAEVDGHPSAIRILFKYDFTLTPEKPTTAIYAGTIRDRANGHPLAGITVSLDAKHIATTKADGTFEMQDVPPGTHTVSISGPKLPTLVTQETFEAGQRLDAAYDVTLPSPAQPSGDSDDIDILVTAPQVEKQVVSTRVSATQAVQLPGTQGDVLKVVESMPGVARAQLGSSALIVWGAAPQDTRTYVDGVPIPQLYHLGGLRSVIASDFVQDVELVPGGYGAAHGNGLGGLVLVGLKPLGNDGIHSSVAADLYQASAAFSAPITDKLRVAIAGEYSYIDKLGGVFLSPEVQEFFPFPRYHDAQARIHYQLNSRESLELVGLYSGDLAQSGVPNSDPNLTTQQQNTTSFYRIFLRYQNQLASGGLVTITPYFGEDDSLLTDTVGSVATYVRNDTTLGGLRAAWRNPITEWLSGEIGLDAEVQSAAVGQVGSLEQPPREGDPYVFGEPPPNQLNADHWGALFVNLAPYGELDFALLNKKLHITPGLRVDPYVRSMTRAEPTAAGVPPTGVDEESFAAEPRLAVTWDINDRVSVHAAAGQYHEMPQATDLSAIFGNPTLPTSTAQHALAGASWHILKTLSAEATGFYEQSEQLAVRNTSTSPTAAEALQGTGSGRSYGLQVVLRQELFHGFFGWVSYTLSRSERQYTPHGPWFLSDYDQTHLLTLATAYDIGHGFNVGLRFRYATGFPRTPVTGAYFDASLDQYEPIFGTLNSIRIPAFVQLDLRAAKEWKVGRSTFELSLDIQNVTDQANPEEIVYSSDFTQKGYITGLPIMPVLGVRWSL